MRTSNQNTRTLVALLLGATLAILCAPNGRVEAFRRSIRSVRRCDQGSSYVSAFREDSDCKSHCDETYIRINHKSLLENNDKALHSLQYRNVTDPETRKLVPVTECCCTFEAAWPEFVRLASTNAESTKVHYKPRECMIPLMLAINLSSRTKHNYEVLCKYFKRLEPLTMLELYQFAEAAAYLNYMQPKHPAIWHVLRNKKVNSIQREEIAELRALLYKKDLFDSYMPLEEFDGYQLKTRRFRRFLELKRELSKALRSKIIARAFDELVISNMLVDVAAAAQHLEETSINRLHVPVEILSGDYDKYDHELAAYFTLPGVDCKLLIDTSNKLQTYLSVLKSLSDMLFEKLNYEKMSEKCAHMIRVLETQRVYKNLQKVNCQSRSG